MSPFFPADIWEPPRTGQPVSSNRRWAAHVESARLQAFLRDLEADRARVLASELYGQLTTIDRVREFMGQHVFAVWDFMTLLKSLQRRLTCVTLPWLPKSTPETRRFVNELVLEEESDVACSGACVSHFELYLAAMRQVGADTRCIDSLCEALGFGADLPAALIESGVPPAARDFVLGTWALALKAEDHEVAAAFAVGREAIIPAMFVSLRDLSKAHGGNLTLFVDYLERHIDLDADKHSPMAMQALVALCGQDDLRWQQATRAARRAIDRRVRLWESISADLSSRARVSLG